MIKGKKSPLYALSRKVKTVPPTGVVSNLKFRKKSELKLFLRWIESSSAALKGIKSPSKKEIKDLDKGSKGGGLGLLALLGIGALGIGAAAGLMGGGSGDGTGGKSGEKNPLAKGISTATDFSGRIPRKINIPKRVVNQKIKPPKTKIKVPKEKIKAPKIRGKGVKTNIKPKIKPNIKPNVVKKPIPKVKPTTFKPQKIVLNKGLKGVGRNIVKKGGSVLAVADAAMTTVDRLQEGQTAKQAFVGGAAEATGSFLGFGKGFKIGAAITAKAAAPLLVAPIPGARILYAAAILTGGIASGFIGSKIGRSVSGGLADRFTGVQKKLETVKAEKKPMGRSYNKRKKKKTIVVPVNNSQNNNNPTGGGSNVVNNNGQSITGGGNGGGGTVIIKSNNQEGMLLTKLDAN
tara:strand:- start:98 stop:1309 length:1212 start_codon:yes stop_codon:yes gene_type:complete